MKILQGKFKNQSIINQAMNIFVQISTVIMLLFFPLLSSSQQSIESVLRRYKNDQNVTSIKYKGENLNKAIQKSKKKLKTQLEYVDVIGFSKGNTMSEKDILKIKSILKQERFEDLINVKSKQGKIKVSTLNNEENIKKIYGHMDSDSLGNYHVVLTGVIYLDEVAEIISSLNMKELDFLKQAVK